MEYTKHSELFNYIIKHKRLPESEAAYDYIKLIFLLRTIHKHGITDCNIKPENLLLKIIIKHYL